MEKFTGCGMPSLRTERLLLRSWRESDLEPFARLNADPKVMKFYPSILNQAESDALAARFQRECLQNGYGFWAVEIVGKTPFIGYVGLNYWTLPANFSPCIDIGWRLASEHWGQGYATEGAQAVLRFGFETLAFPEIVSMATINNKRSRRVMERLRMQRNPAEDFDHPKVPKGHPLSRRVLYRLSYKDWQEKA